MAKHVCPNQYAGEGARGGCYFEISAGDHDGTAILGVGWSCVRVHDGEIPVTWLSEILAIATAHDDGIAGFLKHHNYAGGYALQCDPVKATEVSDDRRRVLSGSVKPDSNTDAGEVAKTCTICGLNFKSNVDLSEATRSVQSLYDMAGPRCDAGSGEAVAWIVLSKDNEKIRIWWRDKERADEWAKTHNVPIIPLYTNPIYADAILPLAPPSGVRGALLMRKALEEITWDGPIWRAQRIAKEALAALSQLPATDEVRQPTGALTDLTATTRVKSHDR